MNQITQIEDRMNQQQDIDDIVVEEGVWYDLAVHFLSRSEMGRVIGC